VNNVETPAQNSVFKFLEVLAHPLILLHNRFLSFRSEVLDKLSYNSQYPNLQRLLNNKYDKTLRRIKVLDGNHQNALIIYPHVDNIPAVTPLMVYPASNYSYPPFVVIVPNSFNQNLINQIVKIVNTYKFLGTKFQIRNTNNQILYP